MTRLLLGGFLVLHCHLICHSNSAHLQQLYTGFALLHRHKKITLTQIIQQRRIGYRSSSPHLKEAGHAHLSVVVNNAVRLHFDTHDAEEVALDELERCDVYFKRSYSSSYVSGLPENLRGRVRRLGLNYRVLPDFFDHHALVRNLQLNRGMKGRLGAIKQAINVNNQLGFQPTIATMAARPEDSSVPRVLFLVAAYDPHDDPSRIAEKREEREFNNELRAECIRLLRAEFGERCLSGFSDGAYARKRYPDLVMSAERTHQAEYVRTLRSYPICIATTGLHGSIGWKFAEYIAFSKAIVSEKLRYEVPGRLEQGRNYLEFTTPDECIRHVCHLMESPERRSQMMHDNHAYYEAYLRPDKLVMNAVLGAMEVSAMHGVELPET